MAKAKKAKGADSKEAKKARTAEKKQKQAAKAEKKAKTKADKIEGDDASDVDLDEILEEYKRQQELFLKVTETVQEGPPKHRAHATLLGNPSDTNSLLLFGGEYFNGTRAEFFNDLHIYNISKDEWRCVTSPNAPLPRSGHAWCRASNPNHVYLFGGEFSSPKQGTFHHYSDFWRLEPATREWTRIEVKGSSPPARSGHRMTYWKQYIILFGGFQDTSNQTKYLADLWIFDTQHFVWYSPVLPPAQLKPDARSSFTLLPHEQGAVLYGGYSRVKTTVVANKQAKGSARGQKNVVKPMVHQDCFFLRMALPPENSPAKTPPIVRWERRKRPANAPNPERAGATMAFHKGRGIMFGGVHDVEMSDEDIDSEFFNALFAWNVERNRFFPLTLRKPRAPKKATVSEQRVGRRGRAQANEEELLRQLAALETGKSLEDLDSIEVEKKPEENLDSEVVAKEMPILMEPPHPRFNAQLAVQEDVLYIYGGTFEKGDREFTFDDLYAIDLVKLSGCKQIFSIEHEDWVESEDEEDDDDEEEEEEEEVVVEDDDGDVEMGDQPATPLFTPSKRKKKQQQQETEADSTPDAQSTAGTGSTDWDEAETNTTVDDGLPHPRPFESRREFFARTTNEWQEVLIASLKEKGQQPETLSVKELKTKAFELSEEKWWDCREEITALEEEQEAAGITEVVSLTERGEGGGHRRR
ncbi:hypothetical protein jhhlp_007338 [Lomentospora prolificans]|uniref:DUF4110 domain-containing protein n=1 Tax=Lomentospora prolificans TaxID=41688 RepID=A0A2N3N2D7_9PEZI|nr:hypothetical protein jhhlp_007338 [Lomentospora prolificans]